MKIAYFGGVTGGSSGAAVDPKILERYTYSDVDLSLDNAKNITVSVSTTVTDVT